MEHGACDAQVVDLDVNKAQIVEQVVRKACSSVVVEQDVCEAPVEEITATDMPRDMAEDEAGSVEINSDDERSSSDN